jgi:hypothetical protein
LREFYKMAIPANSIASAIAYAIEQPAEVEIDEMVIRPTAQDFLRQHEPPNNRETIGVTRLNRVRCRPSRTSGQDHDSHQATEGNRDNLGRRPEVRTEGAFQ